MSVDQKTELPTLHHLNDSQSQRILWLLEELGIDYNIEYHQRNPKTKRAQADLQKVGQGKSPVLITADGRMIIESTAIATYLLKTYDTRGCFAARDWILDEELTSLSNAFAVLYAFGMIFDLLAKHSPWPISYATRAINNAAWKSFLGPECDKAFTFMVNALGDEQWFNGGSPGRADFLLSFPLDMVAQRKWVDFDEKYPSLGAWRTRIQERPAWKRGLEKGNGYDLGKW